VSGGSSFNPLGARPRVLPSSGNVDNDGWGADAPELTRTQLEKVAPAYQPTKVNLAELTSKKEPSRYSAPEPRDSGPEVVRGAYQPVGKVDIAEIRRRAAASGADKDDRPTVVKGAYEPIGKVDIAAIRARAGGPGGSSSPTNISPAPTGGSDDAPKSLSERSGAFQQSERLTSLPKPKVASKFGGSSSFMGTKPIAPGGFSSKTNAAAAPVGIASRTFADEGGKTPAQIWAEKKGRQSGGVISPSATGEPIKSQTSGSGGWQSGYAGKSWAPVQTTHTGKSAGSQVSEQRTGPQTEEQESTSPAGGVGSIRDRFSSNPPPMDFSSKPNASRGVPMPGLPTRPSGVPAEHHVNIPSPPPQPRSPSPPTPDLRPSSPIRVAMPVSRTKEPEEMEAPEERHTAAPIPTESLGQAARRVPDEPEEEHDTARQAGQAAAASTFGAGAAAAHAGAPSSGKRALIQYDYEKAEDNELELREGEYVTNIEMVDDDWWMGQNEHGETGLFPSNYVEIVDDEPQPPPAAARPVATTPPPPAPAAGAGAGSRGKTATAQYDYEAAEDNELSFPDGATIINLVSRSPFPRDANKNAFQSIRIALICLTTGVSR
jgi:hypothetical protein